MVDVQTVSGFRAGIPQLLFDAPYENDPIGLGMASYDVSLDGRQFLMVRPDSSTSDVGYVVVLNWFEVLTRLVPTP